jgi:hypothetical protein
MSGVIGFFKGCWQMPLFWRLWIMILFICNALIPLVFIAHSIAQLTLLSAFVGALVGFTLTHVTGFNKLLGLMHAPWIPMVFMQGKLINQIGLHDISNSHFKLWLVASFCVSAISLVIDFTDVIRYLKGERA